VINAHLQYKVSSLSDGDLDGGKLTDSQQY